MIKKLYSAKSVNENDEDDDQGMNKAFDDKDNGLGVEGLNLGEMSATGEMLESLENLESNNA